MPIELHQLRPTGPFRWKLFLMIMLIMGTITAGAIILTLKAHPSRGNVHAPSPEPVSHLTTPQTGPLLSNVAPSTS